MRQATVRMRQFIRQQFFTAEEWELIDDVVTDCLENDQSIEETVQFCLDRIAALHDMGAVGGDVSTKKPDPENAA